MRLIADMLFFLDSSPLVIRDKKYKSTRVFLKDILYFSVHIFLLNSNKTQATDCKVLLKSAQISYCGAAHIRMWQPDHGQAYVGSAQGSPEGQAELI